MFVQISKLNNIDGKLKYGQTLKERISNQLNRIKYSKNKMDLL